MTIQIHDPDTDDDGRPTCSVLTTDATGTERWYDVHLTDDDTFPDGNLLAGARVDENAPDELAGGGVPSSVFDAAREHFRDRGFDVHGGSPDAE